MPEKGFTKSDMPRAYLWNSMVMVKLNWFFSWLEVPSDQ